MSAATDERQRLNERPVFWAALIFASYAIVAALSISEAINQPTAFILMALATALVIPLTRAGIARQRRIGFVSNAIVRYNRRFIVFTIGYVLGLGLAVSINDRTDVSGIAGVAIALLPVIPILGMVWTMARYLIEEEDEYLRFRAVNAALVGLGGVLTLGSFWGFLETFDLVPHVPAWWTFPAYAIFMGMAQCWMSLRNRGESDQ